MSLSLQSKHIHVTCAIIECNGLVLAAQRNAFSSMPLKWEFPGGKINKGETGEECLHRELKEELGIRVSVQRELPTSTHQYPSFTITLHPFVCTIKSKSITLREHASVAWRLPRELHSLDWTEADLPVLKAYLAEQSQKIKISNYSCLHAPSPSVPPQEELFNKSPPAGDLGGELKSYKN